MGDPVGALSEGNSASGIIAGAVAGSADQPRAHVLFRGVVIDVIHDPAIYDDEAFELLGSKLKDPEMLELAPRNACIVQIVTDQQADKEEKAGMMCFPFFPPYLCMPVKPGEHVWVFVEDPSGAGSRLGYWICRVAEPITVDDLNYTHSDRSFTSLTSDPGDRGEDTPEDESRGVGFPNGGEGEGTKRLPDGTTYDDLYTDALGFQSVTLEPVPRFTKRPGDLVLQGSNNTMICLGEDRGYTKDTIADSTAAEWSSATSSGPTLAQAEGDEPPEAGDADPNERTFSGTIDIVAGRGRYPGDPDAEAELTAARLITNVRNYDEVDKNPVGAGNGSVGTNRLENPAEGDPDFFNDASRIYVSMNTLPDFNFNIEYPDVPPAGDPNDGAPVEPLEEFADGIGQAAIVMKSDELRLIARQDTEQDPPIQGSITIIKEGTADDEAGEGRGIITIRPDGVIMIDGPKVVIGSGIEKGPGEGAQVSLGLAATEPMLLGDLFITAIHNFANNLATTIETSISNLGAPTLMPPLRGHIATLKQEMDDARSKVAKLL